MTQLDQAIADILSQRLEAAFRATIELLPNVGAALIVLFCGFLLSASLKFLARRVLSLRRAREALVTAMMTLIAAITWIITILIAATIALPGLSPAEAFAGLGIGSLAVGLAFRDIFENFLAGILILLREPMRIGDYIECDGVAGAVQRITIRDTYLRSVDGTLRLVPNAFLFKNPVQVLTDQSERRQIAVVGVAYGTDLDTVPGIVRDAVQSCETVMSNRPVQVFACDYANSSIDFEVAWWARATPFEIRRSRDEVLRAIKRAFDAQGVKIPFPHRELIVSDDVAEKLTGSRRSAGT